MNIQGACAPCILFFIEIYIIIVMQYKICITINFHYQEEIAMFIFNTLEHLKDQGFHTLITSCANVLVQSGVNPNLIDIVYDERHAVELAVIHLHLHEDHHPLPKRRTGHRLEIRGDETIL